MKKKIKILITVKTYPCPSEKYMETVCTAGVTESGEFIRLYPVRYRYLEDSQKYEKYQWIELEAEKHNLDPRPESFRPFPSTIVPVGKKISTKENWKHRKLLLFKKPIYTMCELSNMNSVERSLGIIKARDIKKIYAKKVSSEWTGKQKAALEHGWLEGKPKELARIPYEFRFKYYCMNPNCKGHDQSIIDWEIGQLYLKNMKISNDKEKSSVKVISRLQEIADPKNDLYFYTGTVSGDNKAWVLIGMFYPKKEEASQASLLL